MLVFEAEDYHVGKGTVLRDIDLIVSEIEVSVSCTSDVHLTAVSGKKRVLLQTGQAYRFRGRLLGFQRLELKGAPGVEFAYRIRPIDRQVGEPLDDRNPPSVPMPQADNLLLQMRKLFQEDLKARRPPVMEPEDLAFASRYEVDDDDLAFEEEIIANQRDERAKAVEQAKQREAEAREKEKAAESPPEPSQQPKEEHKAQKATPLAEAAE